MNKDQEFYTAEELADRLKLNVITIYRYIRAKKIKAYKIGKEYRIDQKSFSDFINKNIVK
jgi:excisionase family DNA binding protein